MSQPISITEQLFQFIWQFRYFNQAALRLETGEAVKIIFPGTTNQNQGPDFLDARIKIDNTCWVGHIELHLKSSDWDKHEHSQDKNYTNVILHVVLEDDGLLREINIPTLVLQHHISKLLLEKYSEWMHGQAFIPCEQTIRYVDEIIWTAWKQRMLVERLQRRGQIIMSYLEQSLGHWEEIFWWLIAANFGAKVNAMAFEAIARTLPTVLLARHKNHIHQLEALLLGQAGLLDQHFEEAYPKMLRKEYDFLQAKYQLRKAYQPVHFLRMRPGNFPTIRLSQLAALIHRSSHLFSRIKGMDSLSEVRSWLNVQANDYWHYHYMLDEASSYRVKCMGKQTIENIIINTIIPVLYTYGSFHHDDQLKARAIRWMEQIPPEANSVMANWKALNLIPANAGESQAMLEIKNFYCDQKRCLDCAVGTALLKRMA